MALFFDDTEMKCTKCGCVLFNEDKIFTLERHPLYVDKLIKEIHSIRIKCSNCGALIKEYKPLTDNKSIVELEHYQEI